MRSPRSRAYLFGLAVVVAGCGAATATRPARPPSVVPWIAATRRLLPPSPLLRGGDPAAPSCTLAQLGRGRVFLQGATGSLAGVVRLTNIGRWDCTLRGTAKVELLGRAGTALPAVRSGARWPAFDHHRWPGYPVVSLRPGQRVLLPIVWTNYCHHHRPAVQLRLTFSAGTLVIPAAYDGPRCDAPDVPSSLAAGRFTPDGAPDRPVRQLPVRVSISLPAVVRAGDVMPYRITLTNDSRHVLIFHRCPAYWQGLSTDAGQLAHVQVVQVLNCRPTPRIPPGGSRVYAMRFTVPAMAPPGPSAFVWTFEPIGLGGGGKTLFRIIGR
jgi:hypothetical protein